MDTIETECETCPDGIATDGNEICDACARRFGLEARAERVIAAYEKQVRANYSAEWDTIRAVAECSDGIYGAWGEILDVAVSMGFSPEAIRMLDGPLTAAFADLQHRLGAEVAARGVAVPIVVLRDLLDTWPEKYGQLADGLAELCDAESYRQPSRMAVVESPMTRPIRSRQ